MITAERHGPTQAEIIASIIQDAQDAIELATGDRVKLVQEKVFAKQSRERISEVVCEVFDVTESLLKSKRRRREVVDARKAYTMLYFLFNGKNPHAVGVWLKRDRSSVYHYVDEGANLLATNRSFEEKYLMCREELDRN